MKRILALVTIIFVCLLITGCELLFGGFEEHACVFNEWEIVEEATCEEAGEEERYCVICYETETRTVPKLSHTPADYEAIAPTCTEKGSTAGKYCSECMVILSGIEEIEATGHNEVIDPAIPVTDDAPGRTEGKHCSTCGEILVKQLSIFSGNYSDPGRYHGDYGYESLLLLENGEKMAEFYREIDLAATEFHSSLNDAQTKKNGGNDIYYMAEICYSDNGITGEEAISAWCAYIKDHPLYYWMSSKLTYSDQQITVIVDDEYIDGEVREQINADIYNAVEEYVLLLEGEGAAYGITLGFHDVIIKNADYAYEADGVTPSDKNSAHNILGVLLEGEGVCESYAKAFQLLLNYCDIENIFVTGYSGENHAWNLVQLDDGRWYWYDLTWDDQPSRMMGVRHNYFCVTDDSIVDWYDGGIEGDTAFIEDHTPSAAGGTGVNYTYELPARADTPYDYDGLMLRDEIIVQSGLSYVLVGFKSLALIKIETEGDVVIPEVLTYGGDGYSVVAIGSYDKDSGLLGSGSIIDYDSTNRVHLDVTSISIPERVEFIWDFAFDKCYTIESYTVSEDNQHFASVDGVLFTKLLYTLVKYPLAKNLSSYTVPEVTVEIAFGAFGDGGNVFCPEYLDILRIPSNVEVIGATGGNRGFRNAKPENPAEVTMIAGYEERLISMLGSGLRIE